jgi:Uma2 family endonuclease
MRASNVLLSVYRVYRFSRLYGSAFREPVALDASRNKIGQDIPLLTRAPEICIEILSPSNSAAEIAEKRVLYFDAGAAEV